MFKHINLQCLFGKAGVEPAISWIQTRRIKPLSNFPLLVLIKQHNLLFLFLLAQNRKQDKHQKLPIVLGVRNTRISAILPCTFSIPLILIYDLGEVRLELTVLTRYLIRVLGLTIFLHAHVLLSHDLSYHKLSKCFFSCKRFPIPKELSTSINIVIKAIYNPL